MKKQLCTLVVAAFMCSAAHAQIGNVLKRKNSDSANKSSGTVLSRITGSRPGGALSNEDIVAGLKEALNNGTNNAAQRLSKADGFFKDAAIKILMPPEAQKVETRLRALGMGRQVDEAILSMNRAAEDAAKEVAPIFVNAIKGMSIGDAVSILRGGDFAATSYLKSSTTTQLTEKFRPIIEASLAKVNATRLWNTVFTNYNRFSAEKINPDLNAYVTEKALAGLFHHVGLEEQKIRKNPAARSTELLRKVFGQ